MLFLTVQFMYLSLKTNYWQCNCSLVLNINSVA